MSRRHVFQTLSKQASNWMHRSQALFFPPTPRITSCLIACYFIALFSSHSTKLHTIFPLLYFSLHSQLHSLHQTWNLRPARWGITIPRRIKKHTLREPLHVHCRREPIFIANQMFELPTQLSTIVLEIANVCAMILMEQDDDDTDWQISNDGWEDPGESTLSFNIEEDHLDIRLDVLHLDQACRA